MFRKESKPPVNRTLGLFFLLTFALSWLFWAMAAWLGRPEPAISTLILHYLGGSMPPVVAIFLLYTRHSANERKSYWKRAIDFKGITGKWYAVIFLTPPLLASLAILVDLVAGGTGAEAEAASWFITQPLSLIPFAVYMLLFGPLPEELAWRGYALDKLQNRWNALTSSILLGAIWTVWHLPLFFIPGSYQHGLGLGTQGFWLFMIDKIPQSILITWVFNNNRRSTWSAVLFHFMINFLGELVELSNQSELFYIILWILAAIFVTILWGPDRLVRNTPRTKL